MNKAGNMLLVANWHSDVGYAWWLMENFWYTINKHLTTKDKKCILIYPEITKIPPLIQESNITVIEHSFKDTTLKNLTKLRRIIRNNNIRYIYLTDYPPYSWLYVLLRVWGINTIIVHEHTPGLRSIPVGAKRLLKIIIQRFPFYTADHFIAVTEFIRDRMLNVSCIPKIKCFCAPNGIIPYDSSQFDSTYANKAFNIASNKIIIITTGRASYYKGIDFFIECANKIVNMHNEDIFHFIFCGDGSDIDDFKMLVTKYKLQDNFTFAGKRDDIQKILPSCHIGLHTATGEVGYSLSILEYMSAGLVTLVPDNPSTSLATIDGKTGFVYEHKNLHDATSIILDYPNKKEEYNIIRKNAALYIKDHLNLDNTNKALKQIIKQIIPI